jgi:hypothetical protein
VISSAAVQGRQRGRAVTERVLSLAGNNLEICFANGQPFIKVKSVDLDIRPLTGDLQRRAGQD